jgi:hypothetical protein
MCNKGSTILNLIYFGCFAYLQKFRDTIPQMRILFFQIFSQKIVPLLSTPLILHELICLSERHTDGKMLE